MVSKALVAASTKPLILAILQSGESYGYQIIQRVEELSSGRLEWADGMLYPVLHRLESEALIESDWRMSEEGRLRKYYRLTARGREELESEVREWYGIHDMLCRLLVPVASRG